MAEQAPGGGEYADPLVLEHMMGFNGNCKGSVQFHPRNPNIMVSYTGCLLVIADVTNPSKNWRSASICAGSLDANAASASGFAVAVNVAAAALASIHATLLLELLFA